MTNKMQVLVDIINEIREDKDEQILTNITEMTSLRDDVGMDSIDLAVLTANLDAKFGIDIFADGIVDTVGEVLERLEK
jgi:acyl carrier protein